jgi:hypothetical protein
MTAIPPKNRTPEKRARLLSGLFSAFSAPAPQTPTKTFTNPQQPAGLGGPASQHGVKSYACARRKWQIPPV